MNIENIGRTIAIIKGGLYKNKLISVDPNQLQVKKAEDKDNGNDEREFEDFLRLSINDGKFEQYPNLEIGTNNKNKRDVLYISGASGSGKSYYTKTFCMNYLRAFPKNPVFIFSQLVEDDSLKDLGKHLKRIMIDERIVTEPFTYKDFAHSCVIFDDIDALKNKIIKKAICQLKDEMLSLGRHEAITVIVTSHQSCKGHETKDILLESTSCTFFLKGGNNYNTILKSYLGFNDKDIKRLKKFNTRWITMFKQAPQVVMCENDIFLKEAFDEGIVDHENLDVKK